MVREEKPKKLLYCMVFLTNEFSHCLTKKESSLGTVTLSIPTCKGKKSEKVMGISKAIRGAMVTSARFGLLGVGMD